MSRKITHAVGRFGLMATLLAAGALSGCAAVPAPRELVAARAAYARANAGPAKQLTPVEVHDAELALQAAERAYLDESEAPRTRDLAYVAQRKAELAEARANIAIAVQSEQVAQGEREALQAKQLNSAQGELSQARDKLSSEQQRSAMTTAQLDEERRLRQAAQKRAQEALDKLAVAAALAVKHETRGTVITIPEGVLFAFGKYALLPAAAAKLDQVAAALKDQADHKIVVEGHTDSVGSDAFNQELSEQRGKAVRDYLASHGVPPAQITSAGWGKGRPVGDNGNPEGRAQNRRVEIIVTPIEKR